MASGTEHWTLSTMNWPAPDPSQMREPGSMTKGDDFAVGSLAKRAGGDAWRTAKRVWLAVSIPWLAVAAAVLTAIKQVRDHSAVEALEAAFETFASSSSPEQTDAAIETLLDTVATIDYTGLVALTLAWVAGLGIFYIVTASYTTALVCLETENVRRDTTGTPKTATILRSLARIPAMTLAYLYCYLLPWLVLTAAVAGVIMTGGGVLPIAAVLLLGTIGAIYWMVKNSLVGVTVATRRGFFAPVGAATRAVKGRWWAVLWRLLLVSLVVGSAGAALSGFAQIGAVFGTTGVVVLWLVLRVLATLAGTTVTVATQLAMLDALTAETAQTLTNTPPGAPSGV
jgi:hypothetical protein